MVTRDEVNVKLGKKVQKWYYGMLIVTNSFLLMNLYGQSFCMDCEEESCGRSGSGGTGLEVYPLHLQLTKLS